MKGQMVPRKAGWDTHGLPVELEVEKLLDRERTPFFAQAPDEELLTIARELKTELLSAGHSLIHSQQDIIDYLNQIRTQVGFTRKLRRIKYLREQFELQENTNVREVVDAERSVVLEGVQLPYSRFPFLICKRTRHWMSS